MRVLVIVASLAVLALPAAAQVQCCYSWEDGGTILGSYGNLCCDTNVTGPQSGLTGDVPPGTWDCTGAYEGDSYLHVAEDPHSGTPQAYIAWITGLQEGDNVQCTYYGWDSLDRDGGNGEPALRIWAHYSAADDIDAYDGSAGAGNSNTGYTVAGGWQAISSDWTIEAGKVALVIEARLYSFDYTVDPQHTDYWIDYVCVTAPTTACIHFPQGTNPVEDSSWSAIKALYK